MKKRNLIAAVLCSICLVAGGTTPAAADASKIVTLGADLTDAQKNTMMKYFNTTSDQVQIIYVTNADEVSYLGNYISRAQIGTRTLSCAYVKPTNSGGIKVRTANLNYVTCNMIASALSTAGITNCEVVAACPFEVSGTGALTGVMMAYESSTGSTLDETKKDLATQEVVVTGNVGQQVGQDNATNIINQAKMQIIGENIQNADEIYNIVNNIAVQNNVSLSSDEMDTIVSLLQQIAQQSYDIKAMQATLEDIQQNLEDSINAQNGETVTPTPTPEETTDDGTTDDQTTDDGSEDSESSDDGDDITSQVDISALQENGPVIESSTEDANLASDTGYETNNTEEDTSDEETIDTNTGIPAATEDGTYTESDTNAADQNTEEEINQDTIADENGDTNYSEGTDETVDSETGIPEATGDETYSEGTDEAADETTEGTVDGTADVTADETATYDTSSFAEDAQTKFSKTETFAEAAYTGDLTGTKTVMQEAASMMPEITYLPTLDTDTSDKLTKEVEDAYYTILQQENDGTFSYSWDGTESYAYDETNAINKELKSIFGVDTDLVDGDTLYNVSAEDRTALYNATIEFFAGLNNEDSSLFTTGEEAVAEATDVMDEAYTEEETY